LPGEGVGPPPPPDDLPLEGGAAAGCGASLGAGENDRVGSGAGAGALGAGALGAGAETSAGALASTGATRSGAGAERGGARWGARGAGVATKIGGTSLRRAGIAAFTAATGKVDGPSPRAPLPVLVTRPIRKKQANTTQMSAATRSTRGSMRGGAWAVGPSLSVSMSTRAVFMRTGTPSA
jgi:hypothetical protein